MRNEVLKKGFLFYALSTIAMALLMMNFIKSSSVLELMDFEGWIFLIVSCISHASQLALVPFLVFAILVGIRLPRVATVVQAIVTALLIILLYLDSQVYALYHFHINGFVLNMVFGEGASEIFTFDTLLYMKEGLRFAFLVLVVGVLLWLSTWIYKRKAKAYVLPIALSFVGCTLFAHLWHIYASFKQHQSVVKSAALLPYYFPTTANGLMYDLGMVPPESYQNLATSRQESDVRYPINPLETIKPDSLPNILIIAVDSWNKRALTAECMPNTFRFAKENRWYRNHVSSSNGTRSGIFGLFFGLSCYYWESFEPTHIQPLLIDRLLELGYVCQAYPSATLLEPPFAKVIFGNVPNLNVKTEGKRVLERDSKITEMLIADMRKHKEDGKPFFSFVFYDLPHSFELRQEQNTRFQPAWAYADYTKLDNDLDPTPFWNLYRNCCFQDDILLGKVFKALDEEGLSDNTIVILTGDHGQEFNENHRNYWGHNGNFSIHQIGVPMICHFPGTEAGEFSHRTTHYDVVPTLMSRYLGVRNPASDYSMGHLIDDTKPRLWHIVGSNLNYAFIIGGDTILEKKAEGSLDIYDARMKPIGNYKLPVKEFDAAVKNMNRFFKN